MKVLYRTLARWTAPLLAPLTAPLTTLAIIGLVCGCGGAGKAIRAGETEPKDPPVVQEAIGVYKGYRQINRTIADRLLGGDPLFELSQYLEKSESKGGIEGAFFARAPQLKNLLGRYHGDGMNREYQGGEPNSVNILLWYVALGSFASEASRICDGDAGDAGVENAAAFTAEAQETLGGLCAWPEEKASADALLMRIWRLVMAYDAPDNEFERWRNYAQSEELAQVPRDEAMMSLLVAMMYSLYFLLNN